MAIKTGSMSRTASGGAATTRHDGKRERVLWTEGDSNGDSNKELINRTLSTMKGHPTWKIYCGEPTDAIICGKNEPPRYVYLDDRAAYDVLNSRIYTKLELKTFWPFDFDSTGNIRTKRLNRGNPAYADDSCLQYARGPLRGGQNMYEFSGAPEVSQVPASPKKVEAKKVDVKPSNRISLSGAMPTLSFTPNPSTPSTPSTTWPVTPTGTPLGDTSYIYPPRPRWTNHDEPISNARLKYEHTTPKYYVSGPIDGTLKPMGMAQKAMQGSPYFDAPASEFRTSPRCRPGDMSHIREAMKAAASRAPKRGFVVDVFGLHELSAAATKRVKIEDEPGEKEDETAEKVDEVGEKEEEASAKPEDELELPANGE
jgi:hypothetical protein